MGQHSQHGGKGRHTLIRKKQAKSTARHVGTWVIDCSAGFIKWGKNGDTVHPYPPGDEEAVKQAHFIADNEKDSDVYLLRIYDNGQMFHQSIERLPRNTQ